MACARYTSACIAALVAAPAQAQSLTGTWEVQSMGSDRTIQIEQKGNKLVAHRVMWPEFEGEKYKLEHLYRGVIQGSDVAGQLLVKEDELPKFEVLRDFAGTIKSNDVIVLDGLPMRRMSSVTAAPPSAAPADDSVRPLDGPGMSQRSPPPATPSSPRPSDPPALAQATPPPRPVAAAPPRPPAAPPPVTVAAAPSPPAPPSAPSASTPSPAGTDDDAAAQLFASIMGAPGMDALFRVSMQIELPSATAELLEAGDVLYAQKKFKEALAKYEQAADGHASAALLHRMGRCHAKLKQRREAVTLLRRAVRLDPQNKAIRKDYENVKRAKS